MNLLTLVFLGERMNMDGLDVVISEINKFWHGDCIDHQIIGILRYG